MMTESQVRSYILAGGILAAMIGAFFYMRALSAADAVNLEGRQCKGSAVVVKYLSDRSGEGGEPVTRDSFDSVEPAFADSGNLCVFHKIIAKAPAAPASADEMASIRMLLFFTNKGKEFFITRDGVVLSLAKEEKYLVKPDVAEIMIRQIKQMSRITNGTAENE